MSQGFQVRPGSKDDTNVNCIARQVGARLIDRAYYNPKAPHRQPFFKNVAPKKEV